MQVTLIADESVFETAIAAAEKVGRAGAPLRGLNAPLDGATQGRVEEAWEAIRNALESAFRLGRETAKPLLDSAQQIVDQVLETAGAKAKHITEVLRGRIREYLTNFIDDLLKQVRPKIVIGAESLQLSEVQLSQKIVLTSSLKASLTEAFELTSNGEFELSASYKAK